ncbi:hypothetical protein AB0G05_35670, partial [Nonomuraea wenchangensis]
CYSKDHAMAVFISRRHACDQAELVHHFRGRSLGRCTTVPRGWRSSVVIRRVVAHEGEAS